MIFIKDRRVCIKPLRNRPEAIQKLQPPTTVKGCRSFVGMVNFLSILYPELQKLIKPIYEWTRKGRQFVWGKEQQDAFEEIKCRPQFCMCLTQLKGFFYIQIQANLQQEACCIKYKMKSPN